MRSHALVSVLLAGVVSVTSVRPNDEKDDSPAPGSFVEAQAYANRSAAESSAFVTGAKAQVLSRQQLSARRQQLYSDRAREKEGEGPYFKKKVHLSQEDLQKKYDKQMAAKEAAKNAADVVPSAGEKKNQKPANATEPTEAEVREAIESAGMTFEKNLSPEQEERQSLGSGSRSEKQEREEAILAKEEVSSIGAGVDKLAMAMTDPRAFLLSLPGMERFVTGLKVAISLQPSELQGKCLQAGKFKGFGCAVADSEPPVCQCTGVLEKCWQDDKSSIVKTFQNGRKQEAFERAKSLLFGQCYTPIWLASLALAGLLSVIASAALLVYYYYVAQHMAKTEDGSGGSSAFPASVSACLLRLGIKQPTVS